MFFPHVQGRILILPPSPSPSERGEASRVAELYAGWGEGI